MQAMRREPLQDRAAANALHRVTMNNHRGLRA
jgi:hypothetical protein